ncbi:hypothetical protein ABIB83_001954 [Bradyrhizobium sp. I1.8.5]
MFDDPTSVTHHRDLDATVSVVTTTDTRPATISASGGRPEVESQLLKTTRLTPNGRDDLARS